MSPDRDVTSDPSVGPPTDPTTDVTADIATAPPVGAVTDAVTPADPDTETPWRRLDAKMIWVDLLQVLLSLSPTGIAVLIVGVEPGGGTLWPVLGVAIWGSIGAFSDAIRWLTTRYRITDEYVERRTGLLVRRYRSIRLDRIRSIDSTARLRHRIARLRRLKIGAGQHSATGESALVLDAVSAATARNLRDELLERRRALDPVRAAVAPVAEQGDIADDDSTAAPGETTTEGTGSPGAERLIATIDWRWLPYNMVGIWAYLMAGGIIWSANWLAATFGFDVIGTLADTLADTSLGVAWTVVIVVAAVGAVGAICLGVYFVMANWNLRLSRVPTTDGTVLRTTRGLLTTREVNRDDKRLRGVAISEPLLWRWTRMTDTTVITTGLSVWSEAPTVVPRGPRHVAERVAAEVLELEPADSPFAAPLARHPRAALRRRLTWATAIVAAITLVLLWLGATIDGLPLWITAIAAAVWPLAAALAMATYRALGHTISGDYVVCRSGLMAWGTSALRRRAVSGVAIRQSLLQRRLGLASVSVMTAAGWGGYRAPDLAATDAAAFADDASLGLLQPYLGSSDETGR